MLPQENRLKNRYDFQKIKDKGKIFQANNFGMAVLNRKDSKSTRIGFIVSTKVSKKAVVRNKIKRRLRKAVRSRLDQIKDGHDILFLVKSRIIDEKCSEIEKDLDHVLNSAEIIE